MNEDYCNIPRLKFIKFFDKYGEKYYMDYARELLNKLSERMEYSLKLLSVQFHILKGTEPFAAFGFRKRQKDGYFFVEFYSKADINDIRISKKTKKEIILKNKKKEYIINLVEVKKGEKVDCQIVKWIEDAYKLV